jgi:TolB-like protein
MVFAIVGLSVASFLSVRASATREITTAAEAAFESPPTSAKLPTEATVAVFDFEGGSISPNQGADFAYLGKALASLVIADLSQTTLRVVDRSMLAEIIAEFHLNSLSDPATRLRVGRILGAKYLIFGTYTITPGKLALSAWMDSVESGQIIISKAVSGNIQNLRTLSRDIDQYFERAVAEQGAHPGRAVPAGIIVAVPDFEGGTIPAEKKMDFLGKVLASFMIADLASSRNLRFIDSDHVAEILREQRLATSDLSDPSTRLRLGEMLGARYFIFGSYRILRDKAALTARVDSAKTGQILESQSACGESEDLRMLSRQLAQTLIQYFEAGPN